MKPNVFLLAFLMLLFQEVGAAIKLPALVSSHMVLQRDKPIKLWGQGAPQEKLSIEFNGVTLTAVTGKNGRWNIEFPAMKAGGPFSMKITASNTILLEDILIGDVWVCSGQNNMEYPLVGAENGQQEANEASNPKIRLFTVGSRLELKPSDNAQGRWSVCKPDDAAYFSAVGYFFGRDLNKKLDVPIGLINASWSGTIIESWISPEGFKGHPTLEKKSLLTALMDTLKFNKLQSKLFDDWLKKFENSDTGKVFNKYAWASPKLDDSGWSQMMLPMNWEYTGVKKLKNLDGIVWFRKVVVLTRDDLKGPAQLNLGFIMNSDRTFINDREVGFTPDVWGKAREYIVPSSVLKVGGNTIVVRVSNYDGDGGFAGHPSDFFLKTASRLVPLSEKWAYKVGYTMVEKNQPQKGFGPNSSPSVAYNAKIQPITHYSIKGFIWYQGESNTPRAFQYRDLLPRLILNWRSKFGDNSLPFLYVQLANFNQKLRVPEGSSWAELREAQDLALQISNTAMITAIDIGDSTTIHPKNKQEVGRRLSLAAQKLAYKMPVVSSGPHFDSIQVKNTHAIAFFSGVEGGLKIEKGGRLAGFQIAGEDKVFHWAEAQVIGKNTVKISSGKVLKPVAVRYAWENNPSNANLTNGVFPAFPFRSDSWDGVTQ